jgi:flavin reductase (DIM6/NTAB) family NADH-FMN oxidoreductase RutF
VSDWVLDELWAPIVALTAQHGSRTGGLIASSAVAASLLPEAPRVVVQLGKANATHDIALGAGAFALHLLPEDALDLYHRLGMESGDGDKLAGLSTRAGVTGAPILLDAIAFAEARIIRTLDADEATIVVADVVAGERRAGKPLTIELVRECQPPDWEAEREQKLARDQAAARRYRGR